MRCPDGCLSLHIVSVQSEMFWDVSAPEATSTYVWWEAAKTQGKFILHPAYLILLENFSGNLLRLSWDSKGNSHMGIYMPIWGSLLALSLTW